jgi:hypothetical protein
VLLTIALQSENKDQHVCHCVPFKFSGSRKVLGFGYSSRQGAKAPSSKGKDKNILRMIFTFFFPAFAAFAALRRRSGHALRDIPSFGCGFAALGCLP